MRNVLPDRLQPLLTYKKTALLLSFALFVAFEAGIYWVVKSNYDTRVSGYLNYLKIQWQDEFNSVIKTYKIASEVQAQTLAADASLKTILKTHKDASDAIGARDKLLKKFGHIYKSNQALSLRIFQVQNANGDNLIRFQKPEAYGDNILGFRKLIKDVHESGKSAHGFELGRYFNAFRYVFTVGDFGKFLGSIEVGIDESQMLQTLRESFGIDAYLSLESSPVILSQKCAINASFVSDKLCHNPAIYQNGALRLVKKIFDAKSLGFDKAIANKQDVVFYAEVDGKCYAVALKPFYDYSKKYVGYITFYHEDTIILAMKKEFYYFALISMLAFLLFVAAIYTLIRKIKSNALLNASIREGDLLREQKEQSSILNEELARQARELEEVNTELDASYEEAIQINEVLKIRSRELELAEEKFRQMFENMSSGVAVYEAIEGVDDFMIKNVNAAVEKIEKISRDELIGKPLTQAFPGVREFGFLQALKEVYDSGKPRHFPISFYRDDRITGWRENFIYRLSTGEVIVIYDDITALKQIEQEVAKKASQLEHISDNIPNGFVYQVRVGKDGYRQFTYLSHSIQKVLGIASEDVIKDAALLYGCALVKDAQKMAYLEEQAVANKSVFSSEVRIKTSDGDIKWFSISSVPTGIADDYISFDGVAVDVTKLKEAKEALTQSEARLHTIIENEPECVKIMDEKGRLIHMNPAGLAMIEADSFDQVAGELVANIIAPEYRTAYARLHKKVISGSPMQMQYEVLGLKGGRRWLETHAVPMEDNGKTLHLAVTRDISERKIIENQLQKLNEELTTRVEEETNKRLEKEKLLQQQSKMAMMGEMIGAIAHQWRQPLNSLGLKIQDVYMAYQYGELNDEYLANFKNNSMGVIKSMSKTIDDFRDFFKPTKSKEDFIVEGSIHQALYIMTPLLHASAIELEFAPDKEHLAHGYKNEFQQVVIILLSNAKDALCERAIENPRITIETHDKPDAKVEITISDNARGVPPEIIDRIFEPYFTTKEQGKGAGIGLYMAKEIVERQMNGKISVENTQNGAKFTILLNT